MKKKIGKFVGLIAVLIVFGIFALGSESSESSSGSVTIKKDDTANSAESNSGSENSEDTANELKYEVTDIHFNYYTNSIGRVEYYGYVEITNTGSCNLYMNKCTFDLEDNDGHLLQSDSFISSTPSVVKPGEKGYFYNSVGSALIDEGVSLDNGVNLVPNYKISKATGMPDEYEVSDTELKQGSFGYPKVTGRITNSTDRDCNYLYINIIFYDSNGKVLGIEGTSVTDLYAGGKVSFDCSCMFLDDSITVDKIADYKVIAQNTYMQF